MAYPDSFDGLRMVANRPGIVYDPNKQTTLYANDLQNLQANINRTQETLGLNPEGSKMSVAERLEDMDTRIGKPLLSTCSFSSHVNLSNSTWTTVSPNRIDFGANQAIKIQGGEILLASDGLYSLNYYVVLGGTTGTGLVQIENSGNLCTYQKISGGGLFLFSEFREGFEDDPVSFNIWTILTGQRINGGSPGIYTTHIDIVRLGDL